MKPWLKKVLIGVVVILVAGAAIAWYLFNEKFTDTSKRDEAYKTTTREFLNEFRSNRKAANEKYAEQIITVNGKISEIESADTSINIKFSDEETGGYIIFAFQQQNMSDARKLKEGDSVSIKGSCSGGAYSEILETDFITFKRCVLNKL